MSWLSILHFFQGSNWRKIEERICPKCGHRQRSRKPFREPFRCLNCQFKLNERVEPVDQTEFKLGPRFLLELAYLIIGVVSATIGLKGFLIPNGLIDGGVTGVSMLCAHVTRLELGIFIILINIPFIVMAYRSFSREFALRAGISMLVLSVALHLVPDFPVTKDRLLDAVFGGFFLGAGIAFSIRGGGVLDGTEILALFIGKRFPTTVGDSILFFNIGIFSVSLLFLGTESVLYSILTYFSASKTVDFIMNGIESFNGVLIFSKKSDQLKFEIVNSLKRGVTILKGKGGYSDEDQEILLCVLTRLEIAKLNRIVDAVDPRTFKIVFPISDAKGGYVKKLIHEKAIAESHGHTSEHA